MPNFPKYVNFKKTLIFLTSKNNFFENFNFSKKLFFFHFCLVLQADLNVFLRYCKMSSILRATCPQLKNFIGDNTLVPKMIKSHLICISWLLAHFFLISSFDVEFLGRSKKKADSQADLITFFKNFRGSEIELNFACHMTATQKFYLRQHFST